MNPNLLECRISNERGAREYPFSSPLYRGGFTLQFDRNVTFLVGDNGVGKSTLLEGLAAKIGFSPSGGGKDHVLQYGSFSALMHANSLQSLEEDWEILRDSAQHVRPADDLTLAEHMRLIWRIKPRGGFFFRAESFLLLTALERYECKQLSHGEGIIQLMSGFTEGIFLLDEPESGLSPSLQLRLIYMIEQQARNYNAQFIISTHSPILMAYPHAQLLLMDKQSVMPVSFRDTPHYALTKRILADPESFYQKFFAEDEPSND